MRHIYDQLMYDFVTAIVVLSSIIDTTIQPNPRDNSEFYKSN
jgi:hypothetical protein